MLFLTLLDHECQLIDTDLPGSDLGQGIADIPSWLECGQLCSNTPDCGSFTWNSVNSYCFLKRGVPNQSAFTGSISGMASCFNSTTEGILYLIRKHTATTIYFAGSGGLIQEPQLSESGRNQIISN